MSWQFEIEGKGLGGYYEYRIFNPLFPDSEITGKSLCTKEELTKRLRKTVKRLTTGEGHKQKLINQKGE